MCREGEVSFCQSTAAQLSLFKDLSKDIITDCEVKKVLPNLFPLSVREEGKNYVQLLVLLVFAYALIHPLLDGLNRGEHPPPLSWSLDQREHSSKLRHPRCTFVDVVLQGHGLPSHNLVGRLYRRSHTGGRNYFHRDFLSHLASRGAVGVHLC